MRITEHKRIVAEVDKMKDLFIKGRVKPYRVATKVWKHILINEKDRIVIDGLVRRMVAKSLGAGVYSVSISPKKARQS